MNKIISVLLLLSISSFTQDDILENYIKSGIENNLAIKQKQFSLEQSIAALDEARGMFFPSIEINARYSRAGGGRDIVFPVGDLFNPIYGTLNALTQTQAFPTNLKNEVIPFLREKEHETKISLVQPIIQPALFYNYSIKSNLVEIQESEKNVYIRKLFTSIKSAYYNYLKSRQVYNLFTNTIDIVAENLRVSKSLYKNDKVTIDVVHRAKAELLEIEQKQLEAEKNVELAASHFNFLLNKPFDSEIKYLEKSEIIVNVNEQNGFEESAMANREELNQLELAAKVAHRSKGLAEANYYPGLALAIDYGFQGEKYKFGKEDDYWMASLVLNWNLFNGFQDKAKSEIAELEGRKLSMQILELKNQIKLQVKEAFKNMVVAEKEIESTRERLDSYRLSFRIVNRKFSEGMSSQLEYLDARNKLTQAEVQFVLAKYNYKQKYAVLEEVAAKINLNMYK